MKEMLGEIKGMVMQLYLYVQSYNVLALTLEI